jgi:hypothetical protein
MPTRPCAGLAWNRLQGQRLRGAFGRWQRCVEAGLQAADRCDAAARRLEARLLQDAFQLWASYTAAMLAETDPEASPFLRPRNAQVSICPSVCASPPTCLSVHPSGRLSSRSAVLRARRCKDAYSYKTLKTRLLIETPKSTIWLLVLRSRNHIIPI